MNGVRQLIGLASLLDLGSAGIRPLLPVRLMRFISHFPEQKTLLVTARWLAEFIEPEIEAPANVLRPILGAAVWRQIIEKHDSSSRHLRHFHSLGIHGHTQRPFHLVFVHYHEPRIPHR